MKVKHSAFEWLYLLLNGIERKVSVVLDISGCN